MTDPQRLDAMQIIDLLTVAASYDSRTASDDEVKAWTAAAVHARWDFQLALTAIIDHYANRTERIMPGHITAYTRSKRQDAALRYPVSRTAIPGALNGGWPVGDDPHWGRRNSPELERVHAGANVEPCRDCGAVAGERCTNAVTGHATKVPHPARLRAATSADAVPSAA